ILTRTRGPGAAAVRRSERSARPHLRDERAHDGVQLAPVAARDRALALVGRAATHDRAHAVELVEAPEARGDRLELDEQAADGVGHELLVALAVEDDDRVHPVPRRAPLVLLREPRRDARELAALVEHRGV